MKTVPLFLIGLALGSCAPAPAPLDAGKSRNTAAADSFSERMRARTSAAFDYYLLNLSWAPEFCYSKPDNPECSGHFGFIVHGLWPQYSRGGYPENCGRQPGPSNPSAYLDIMPDLHLIQHEWTTHGTCTGLSADDYFALIRRIYSSIKIPGPFVGTPRQLSESPAEIKQQFEQANPQLKESGLAVSCGGGGGGFLVAMEICFTKDGKPTQCGSGIRDCNRPTIRIPKVQ